MGTLGWDLVLWRVLNQGGFRKRSPSWEEPFKVMEMCRPGGNHRATAGAPLPNLWSISVSSVHRSKLEGLSFFSFVTRLRIRVRQPDEVRPHKPGMLAYTHACRVIKRSFTPSDVLL
jgi:hypothetical protein